MLPTHTSFELRNAHIDQLLWERLETLIQPLTKTQPPAMTESGKLQSSEHTITTKAMSC